MALILEVDPEFRDLIPPPSPAELATLEASIIAAGRANVPIDTWRGVIVDGHNRYAICTAAGLPFETREVEFASRDEAKAWIFENQIGRRNLTPDQVVMLAVARGLPLTRGTARQRRQATDLASAGGDWIRLVLAGKRTLTTAHNDLLRERGLLAPRPPRAPTPHVPVGHELAGQSTLTDAAGDTKATWHKTRTAGAELPPHDVQPPGHLVRRTSTMLRADGTAGLQWVSTEPEKVAQWEATKAAIVEHVQTYVRAVAIVPPPSSAGLLEDYITQYNLGDPHIGLLAWAPEVGESFDLKIAESELCQCFRMLVDRATPTARAIVTNLGDFWHAQNASQTTPRGHNKLDVDGRKGKVGQVGLAIVRTVIDTALAKHSHVDFRCVPGNHDPDDAFWLAETMRAEYRNEPRVTVHDAFNPYQFERFGNNLFGWCHGDGAKIEALGEIMSVDARELWGLTEHHYWNVGHVHHSTVKELRGCTVETHNTLANRDAWHHHSGYRSKRNLKVHTYHKDWGLDGMAVVGVERVRAALLAAAGKAP